MLGFLSALALAMGTPETASHQCEALDGWNELLAEEDARYIVVGEMHGTAETPALFADIVCQTGQQEPVVVALEQPETAQAEIDRFLASDGGEQARELFLRSGIWTDDFKDGRSSEAMFSMFEKLRQYLHAGLVSRVVAFQVTGSEYSSPQIYEQALADKIIEMAGEARVLVYIGNVHALRQEVPYRGGYMPMAGLLPGDETITFDTIGNGGETWACSAPEVCGEISLGSNPDPQVRHVMLAQEPETARYSGAIFLGTTTTPSPPRQP